jgi:cytoskeletal protein RodZ
LKEGPTYQYSAEDIQRYLDGKMDPAGMHALERAALEDPFLADAIEGFREMRPNLKEDIMEMQNKLSEKKKEERKRRWIPIAIALLLLLSFGGWFMFREDGGGQQQIAKQEGSQPATQEMTQASQDSMANSGADNKAGTQSNANKDLTASKPDNTKAEESKPAEVASTKAAKAATGTEPATSTEVAPAAAPVASVDAAARKANESAKKTLTAPAKSEAELSKQADAQTAAPTARKKGAYQFETLEMAKNVEPVTGWNAFAKYIQSNMQRPAGGMHGTVGTNFIVAPDGSISDIVVVKSLHPDYDKEAVRLLQNGPKWKASNGGDKAVKAVYNVVF